MTAAQPGGIPTTTIPATRATRPTRTAGGSPGRLYDVDPDTVAARVLACPAVAGLSGGPLGTAATYLPGRRVAGVQITPDAVRVHVVGRYGIPVTELAGQIRRALTGQIPGRTLDIVVEDLAGPEEPTHGPPPTPAPAGLGDPPAATTTWATTTSSLAVEQPPAAVPPARLP